MWAKLRRHTQFGALHSLQLSVIRRSYVTFRLGSECASTQHIDTHRSGQDTGLTHIGAQDPRWGPDSEHS